VLTAGRKVWSAYFQDKDARSVREQYRLNRPDVQLSGSGAFPAERK
jgi:hypothetical protein